MRIERGGAINGVNHRDDAIKTETHQQIGVIHNCVQDRRRIGEACRLKDHASKRFDAAVVELAQQIFERVDQIAADRAADAARTHQHHVAVKLLNEEMIEADIAKLIDQNQRVGQFGRNQQAVQQRGFAGAKEAGENSERDRRRRPACGSRCAVRHCAAPAVAGVEALALPAAGFVAVGLLAEGFAVVLPAVGVVASACVLAAFAAARLCAPVSFAL